MRLRCDVTLDDVIAFSQHHWRQSPHARQQMRRGMVIVSALAITVFGLLAIQHQDLILLFALALTLPVFWIAYPPLCRRQFKRNVSQLYLEGSTRGIVGGHEFEALPDGFVDRTEFGEQKTYWPGILKVDCTQDHVFVYISSVSAHIISLRGVTEGDLEGFIAEAKRRWQAASALQFADVARP
jgi:hypothetical protein